eukprot:1152181-Pelagomonas_calceolata.AAC.3
MSNQHPPAPVSQTSISSCSHSLLHLRPPSSCPRKPLQQRHCHQQKGHTSKSCSCYLPHLRPPSSCPSKPSQHKQRHACTDVPILGRFNTKQQQGGVMQNTLHRRACSREV